MFLKDIINWIQLQFKRIPKELREKARQSKIIVDVIIRAINSPGVIILTELTKTELDDQARAMADICLRRVSNWLGGVNVDDIPYILRERSEKERNAILFKIGSEVLSCLHGNTLRENQYDLVSQAVYSYGKL